MSPRQLAEKWRRHEPGHDHGYVIIYRGEVAGWTRCLDNAQARSWKSGCMAVPPYRNAPMFMAEGHDSSGWGGAARWELMDSKYEPV